MNNHEISNEKSDRTSENIYQTMERGDRSLQCDADILATAMCSIREKVFFLSSLEYVCNHRGQIIGHTKHDYILTSDKKTINRN